MASDQVMMARERAEAEVEDSAAACSVAQTALVPWCGVLIDAGQLSLQVRLQMPPAQLNSVICKQNLFGSELCALSCRTHRFVWQNTC